MTIDQFSIRNADALKIVECENLPDLMVIAGPNGVGKSTLLQELRDGVNNPGKYDLNISNDTKPIYISPHRAPEELSIDEVTLSKSESEGFIDSMSEGSFKVGRSPDLPTLLRQSRPRSRFQADFAPYFEVKRELADLYRERSEIAISIVDRENYVRREDLPEISEPIKKTVDYLLPGISFEEIRRENNEYKILFRNPTDDIVEFDELSSGERDSLAIAFSFLSFQLSKNLKDTKGESTDTNDLVILLDGPESYMHPQLQLNILNFIENKIQEQTSINLQVIMVTHSKVIIDNVPEQSLYYLFYYEKMKGENQLKPATELPTELKEVISEEIGLSALSSGEDLLLVEGVTDREVFGRIDPELEAYISIIPIGGKEAIIGLDNALNEIVPKLEESSINLYAIVDRDRNLSLNSNVNQNVHVLPATMVENLVLKPGPLFSTLEEILGRELEKKGITTPSDIEDRLANIVQKDSFIDQESQLRWNEQFNPLNISYRGYDKSSGFGSIEEFAKNELKNHLNDVDDYRTVREEVIQSAHSEQLDKLHGKNILSQISNTFGVESNRLLRMTASRVEMDHLPQETKKFLEQIKSG